MNKAIIADIQRFSVHDGPGIRTTIFLKGCPLKCEWCHNPECISPKPVVMYYLEKCINCGRCDEGCFTGAKKVCGVEYSTEQIMREIIADKAYYGSDGGVTFSGGEAMIYKNFLSEIVDMCHSEGINCALETSLYIYDESVLRKFDIIMADIKIWDEKLHRKYTGVSNKNIINNFKKIDKLGVPIIARTPVLCEIEQGIKEISSFLKTLTNVVQYELLPYHPLGQKKAEALGITQKQFKIPNKEYMEELKRYVFIRK